MAKTASGQRQPLRCVGSWLRCGLQGVMPVDTRASTWARRLDSFGEVPAVFRPFLETITAQQQPFPYLVLTPTFRGIGRRLEHEKLVCLAGDAVHVVEDRDGHLSLTRLPIDGQCRVERGVLLLNSWIVIHGSDSSGASGSATLLFNSLTDHLMEPFVDALRARPPGDSSADAEAERARLNYLAQTHYKFYSHGRNSLRPGDRVLKVLFQPELRRGQVTLFGYSVSRRLAPAHLTILTEAELITIRDDESQFWIKGTAPVAIWNYIPRRLIVGASIGSADTDYLTLRIETAGSPALQSLYATSARADIENLKWGLQS